VYIVELVKEEEQHCASHLRCGSMTPNLIEDDFEQELGCPTQVIISINVLQSFGMELQFSYHGISCVIC